MVKRVFELRAFVDRVDPMLVEVLLSAREELQLAALLDLLKKIESVSKHLQFKSPEKDVRWTGQGFSSNVGVPRTGCQHCEDFELHERRDQGSRRQGERPERT